MDLIAYVKGDITVVTEILSQVAMLTDSDNFLGAVTLAMIAGFAASLLQGLLRGGQFSVMGFFIPAFLYTIAILPRADLVIENDRTGAISRIDDVPIGIAAPISLITVTGHEITEMMETVLGVSDNRITTDNGVLFATRAPLVYQWMLTQPDVINFENKGEVGSSGLNVYDDTRAYVFQCVAPELATGRVSYGALSSGDITTALRVNNSAQLLTSQGTGMSCEQAFDELNNGMASSVFLEGLEAVLNNYMARYSGDTEIGPRYRAALQNLVDDEADFVRSIVWMDALTDGSAMFKGQGGSESTRAALNDALVQRLENNRGASAIVFETINMTVSFLEAWSFAIMPIMLLVLVFGAIGWPLAAKYFWLLIWIQLWHLTILIVLDFMEMQARAFPSSDVDSIAHGRSFLEHAMRLEDTGYMMLSMATMLSMGLLYGTSAVFGTGLQRAIAGADHYNEKKVFADTLSRAPINAMQSSFEHSPSQGWQGVGAASSFGNLYFSLDRTRAEGVSKSDLISRHFTDSASAGRNVSVQDGYQRGDTGQKTHSDGRTESTQQVTGRSLASQSGVNTAGSFGSQLGTIESQNAQSGGKVGTQVDAGVGTAALSPVKVGLGVSGGFDASVVSSDLRSQGNTIGRTTSTNDAFTLANRTEATHSRGQRAETTDASTQSEGTTESGSVSDVAGHQVNDAMQFGQSHTTNSSDGTRASVGTGSVSGIAVANNLARDGELMDEFVKVISETGIAGAVENFMVKHHDELSRTFKDPDAIYAFAGMYVMQGMGGYLPGKSAEQLNALNAIGDDFIEAVTFGSGFDMDSKVDTGELMLLERGGKSPTGEMDQLGLRVGANIGAVRENLDGRAGPMDMMTAFKGQLTTLGAASEELMGDQVHGVFSAARENLDARSEALATPNNWMERVREDGWLKGVADSLGVGSGEEGKLGALAKLYRDDRSLDGPDATLRTRLDRFNEASTGTAPNDLTEYMALEQLRAGAAAIGLNDDAAAFEFRMRSLESLNPALAGETGERIREIARDASTKNGFNDRVELAQAEMEYGQVKAQAETQLGMPIVDDGSRNAPAFSPTHGPNAVTAYSGALAYNERDIDLGARTLVAEAGNQGYEGMLAVANVIRNRVEDDRWSDSVAAVVMEPGQFSAWNDPKNGGNALGYETGPGDPRYEQARAIMASVMLGDAGDVTGGATHYYSPKGLEAYERQGISIEGWGRWWSQEVAARGGQYVEIGDHRFAGLKR